MLRTATRNARSTLGSHPRRRRCPIRPVADRTATALPGQARSAPARAAALRSARSGAPLTPLALRHGLRATGPGKGPPDPRLTGPGRGAANGPRAFRTSPFGLRPQARHMLPPQAGAILRAPHRRPPALTQRVSTRIVDITAFASRSKLAETGVPCLLYSM